MQRLLTGHAGAFNRRYRRVGHLFQNRYRSTVCEEEPYFLELVRYIHLNPLRAKLVKDLKELEAYPYSGHPTLVGKISRPWQETDEVLSRFGERRSQAITKYREFVAEGLHQGRRPDLMGGGLVRSVSGRQEAEELMRGGERLGRSGNQLARTIPHKPSDGFSQHSPDRREAALPSRYRSMVPGTRTIS